MARWASSEVAAAVLSAAGCARAPVVRVDPFLHLPEMRELRQCETSIDRTVCGTWTWDSANGHYLARWENGASATLKLDHYDGNQLIVSRDDDAGPTPGMTARYVAARAGASFRGTVNWSWRGRSSGGTWEATIPQPASSPGASP